MVAYKISHIKFFFIKHIDKLATNDGGKAISLTTPYKNIEPNTYTYDELGDTISDIISDIDNDDNINFPTDVTVVDGMVKSSSDEVFDVFSYYDPGDEED